MRNKCILLYVFIIFFQFYVEASNLFTIEQNQETSTETDRAFGLLAQVKKTKRFVTKLDSIGLTALPVGIGSKDAKDREKYAIIVSGVKIKKEHFLLEVYMAFTIPGTTKKIAFKGVDIPFYFSGGMQGDGTLELLSDIDVDLTNSIKLILKGFGKTSVKWDCYGFKEMNVDADVLLDSTLFIPENNDGTLSSSMLKTSFKTTISSWDNLLVDLSFSPFQIKNLKGISFKITNAVFDLSDLQNPSGIMFNKKYNDFFIEGNKNIWQGLYIREAEIKLPKQFKKKSVSESDKTHSERIHFYAQNLLLDELGFTAKLSVDNLMTIDEGDLSGWKFSVDNFFVDIQANSLIDAKFRGKINVPEFEQNTLFDYNAQFGVNDTYSFNISITDSIKLNMWAANMQINPNSALKIDVVNSEFRPLLLLNGTLSLDSPIGKNNENSAKFTIGEIPFEGMQIQTIEPYFKIKHISYGKKQNNLSKFPISINKIDVSNLKNSMGLSIGLTVNFVKENKGGFGGDGIVTVWGKRENKQWKYDRVEINNISVDISKGKAFELKGKVVFIEGDEIFGNGFKGILDAKFGGFGMKATALFGKVNNYRYWFADALLTVPTGIPVGPISIYGFGGGAYYHIKQDGLEKNAISDIGKSASGIYYRPDKKTGLGLKSMVKFGLTGKKETLNGDAEFGISFNLNGGINQMAFKGNAYFATNNFNVSKAGIIKNAKHIMDKTNGHKKIPKDDKKSQLHGDISMIYDFPNESFHSNFNIYVNIAGGIIKGTGQNNRAGWGVIHFDPSDWYAHLGTPKNPNGITVLNIAKMDNYFMTGKTVPELPDPPDYILKSLNMSNAKHELSNLGDGSGFIFGSSFYLNTGERNFLIFYGKFGCSLGFDILMKNYGNTRCEGSNKPIGINGWYAQGQAYAWVAAAIGIKVDLPFYSGKYSIFDMEVATLMQAKAPNPFWMKGNVGGHYNILGGLVKGSCSFEFEIGEQCKKVSSNPLGGMQIISNITPEDKEDNVDVFSTPQVVFNMPINKDIEFENEKKQTKRYRIKLNYFKIKEKNGNNINGTLTWNKTKDVLAFKSNEILPGQKSIKASVSVSFQELKNDTWFTVIKNGKVSEEKKEITFNTDKEPDYIPQKNIAYSYPQNNAFNYYKMETNNNYIKLKSGQKKLFNPGEEWKQKIKLTPVAGGKSIYTDFNYNVANKQINFYINKNIINNKIFRLDVVNIPIVKASKIDENVNKKVENRKIENNNYSTEVSINTKVAEGSRKELQEKIIYTMRFRTSIYNTFKQKIVGLNFSNGVLYELQPQVHSITSNITGERFDSYEVINFNVNTMVKCSPILSQTEWYVNHMQTLFDLSTSELQLISAQPFKPNKLVTYFFQSEGTSNLTKDEANAGFSNKVNVTSGMKNYIANDALIYLYKLKGNLANSHLNKQNLSVGLMRIFNANFIPLKAGNYPVRITYTLPGKSKANSTFKHIIKL